MSLKKKIVAFLVLLSLASDSVDSLLKYTELGQDSTQCLITYIHSWSSLPSYQLPVRQKLPQRKYDHGPGHDHPVEHLHLCYTVKDYLTKVNQRG